LAETRFITNVIPLMITRLIVTRRKRSRLSRFLFGSAAADLMMQAPCPVKVIDEE